MGFFSSIFGGGVHEQNDTGADAAQVHAADSLVADSSRTFYPAIQSRLAQIANPGALKSQTASFGAADTAQQAGPMRGASGGRGPSFDRVLGRGQALAKITAFGDRAVGSQNLSERIAALKFGRGIRSGAYKGMGAQTDNQATIQNAQWEATQTKNAGFANLIGGVVGMGGRLAASYAGPSGSSFTMSPEAANYTPDTSGFGSPSVYAPLPGGPSGLSSAAMGGVPTGPTNPWLDA